MHSLPPAMIPATPEQVAAIDSLLTRIPTDWHAFDPTALSDVERAILNELIVTELVERKMRFLIRLQGQPLVAEATIAATGVRGLEYAMGQLAPRLAETWPDLLSEPAFSVEQVQPDEWKLTEDGIGARGSFAESSEARDLAVAFILKKGILAADPRGGRGILESFQGITPEAAALLQKVIDEALSRAIRAAEAELREAMRLVGQAVLADLGVEEDVKFFMRWPKRQRKLMELLWDGRPREKDWLIANLPASRSSERLASRQAERARKLDSLRKTIAECESRLIDEGRRYVIDALGTQVTLKRTRDDRKNFGRN